MGKTTLVTNLSLHSALQGQRTLAMTFDPSLRLKDLLTEEVMDQTQNLEVFLIDPAQIFEHLLGQINPEEARAFKNNRLFGYLLEGIVGLQEFTSLYYLVEMMRSQKYDVIYVDTPPFQNALEFFYAPEKFRKLFESKILRLFIESENENFITNFIKSSSRMALKTLQNLTGLEFFKQLLDFIRILETIRPTVLNTLNEIEKGFKTGAVLVDYISAYGIENVVQADDFLSELKGIHLKVERYYVSKYMGRGLDNILEQQNLEMAEPLRQFLQKKAAESQIVEKHLQDLSNAHKVSIIRVPYFTSSMKPKEIAEKWDEHTRA